ncbi:hypothetical protein EV715DRAFT_262217 [Schizophyllum commune]
MPPPVSFSLDAGSQIAGTASCADQHHDSASIAHGKASDTASAKAAESTQLAQKVEATARLQLELLPDTESGCDVSMRKPSEDSRYLPKLPKGGESRGPIPDREAMADIDDAADDDMGADEDMAADEDVAAAEADNDGAAYSEDGSNEEEGMRVNQDEMALEGMMTQDEEEMVVDEETASDGGMALDEEMEPDHAMAPDGEMADQTSLNEVPMVQDRVEEMAKTRPEVELVVEGSSQSKGKRKKDSTADSGKISNKKARGDDLLRQVREAEKQLAEAKARMAEAPREERANWAGSSGPESGTARRTPNAPSSASLPHPSSSLVVRQRNYGGLSVAPSSLVHEDSKSDHSAKKRSGVPAKARKRGAKVESAPQGVDEEQVEGKGVGIKTMPIKVEPDLPAAKLKTRAPRGSGPRQRDRPSNADLNLGTHEMHKFRKLLSPAVWTSMGRATRPFEYHNTDEFCENLSTFSKRLLPDTNISYTKESVGYKQIVQKVYDWRRRIGLRGLEAVRKFFEETPDDDNPEKLAFPTAQERKRHVEYLLQNDGEEALWIYSNPEEFVYRAGDIEGRPIGALALAASAVQRALGFWSSGNEVIPPTRGDKRDRDAMFGEHSWGEVTDGYADDIADFVDDAYWQKIIKAVDENLNPVQASVPQPPSQASTRKRIVPKD